MSYGLNGIININGSDYASLGTINVFTDVLNQFGTTVVGYQNVISGITTADSMIIGNKNSLNDALNSGIIGQSCTIQPGGCQNTFILAGNSVALDPMVDGDISYHTLVGGRYVMIKENFKTTTGALVAGPKYIQMPGVAGVPTGTLDNRGNTVPNGALTFDSVANNLYIHKAGVWEKSGSVTSVGLAAPAEFTVSGSPVVGSGTLTLTKANQSAGTVYAGPAVGSAQPTFRALTLTDIPFAEQSWSETLAVNTGSGPYTPSIEAGQAISFESSIWLWNGGNPGSVTANNIGIGSNVTSTGLNAIAIGISTVASGSLSAAIGASASATHSGSTAIGFGATTTEADQIVLGTSTSYAFAPGYYRSAKQKAAAVGVDPTVPDPTQAITTGSGLTTIIVQRTFFDWTADPMVSGNTLLLTDTTQIWGVSINVAGTFTGALTTNVWTLHLVWYDGTTNKYIASNDFFASNTATVFNGVIGSGIKTNGSAGQYIFAQITNTTGGTMTVTKFRMSAIRMA